MNAVGSFPTRMEDIPEEFRLAEMIEQDEYLVGGELRHWQGERQEVFSPICLGGAGATRIGSFPKQGADEALAALDAAVKAYDHGRGEWPTCGVEERIRRVADFAARMKELREPIVRLLMWEIGKSLGDARKEFDRTVEYMVATIDALKNLDRVSSRFVIEEGVVAQIRRAPLGVVLCMGPFNYPLNETMTTLIPALIMGNTVVFKPPKLGILLYRELLPLFRDCFPKGVVNTVYGKGAQVVGPLMESGKIDVLAFIGSSRVADTLKKQHPQPHRLRSVLGLDAKNPAIVLADADLEATARECALGALSYNGQRCTALKMIFVHQSVAEEFIRLLSQEVDALVAGMPWDEGVKITPLPEPGKTGKMRELIEDACALGAKVVNAGGQAEQSLMRPAVLFPVSAKARLYREEQFGPVVPVASFADLNEALEYVVSSNYGQQLSVFGRNPKQLAALIDPLTNQVCRVNLNSQCQRGPDSFPFTGRKDSAEGTLSVSDALRVFTIRTLVAAKNTPENQGIITSMLRGRDSTFLSTDFIL